MASKYIGIEYPEINGSNAIAEQAEHENMEEDQSFPPAALANRPLTLAAITQSSSSLPRKTVITHHLLTDAHCALSELHMSHVLLLQQSQEEQVLKCSPHAPREVAYQQRRPLLAP